MHTALRNVAIAAVALATVLPSLALAGTTDVAVKDNSFSPDAVRVRVGGSVHWTDSNTSATHNVREDARIFNSGLPAGDVDYKVSFSAGTFHYYCENHGSKSSGMDGVVKVPVTVTEAPIGTAFTVQWATSATKTGSKFDVQYQVGSGAWKDWKKNATAFKSIFGAKNDPVAALEGKTYSFRARSQKGDNASRWSPVRSFKV